MQKKLMKGSRFSDNLQFPKSQNKIQLQITSHNKFPTNVFIMLILRHFICHFRIFLNSTFYSQLLCIIISLISIFLFRFFRLWSGWNQVLNFNEFRCWVGNKFCVFFGDRCLSTDKFYYEHFIEKDPINSILVSTTLIYRKEAKKIQFSFHYIIWGFAFLHFQFFHHRVGFSSVDFPFLFFLNLFKFLTHVLNSDAINHEKVDKNERNPNPRS